MASTRSTIELVISGSLRGLTTAVAAARATLAGLEQQAKSLDNTAAKAGAGMAVLGTGIAALSGNFGGVVSGVKVLKDFGTALGHLPEGAERLPSVVQRIIQVSAAVSLFAGGARLLAQATVGLRGIGAITGALSQFGGVVERLAGPLRFVASAATGFLTVIKGFSIIKTVTPYFELFGHALAAVGTSIKVVQGLVTALKQLAPIALLLPAALSGLGVVFGTIKLGLLGFGDAVKKGGEDLAKLGPNARATAQALRDMAPAAQAVKNAVQDALFKGLSTEVQKLGGTYLPLLKTQLAGVAQPLNGLATSFVRVLNSGQSVKDVNTILDGTKAALKGIEPAAGAVLAGFLRLASAGIKNFAGLGNVITDVAVRFRDWANALVISGRFDEFVNRAIRGFMQLKAILENVGSIIATVFRGLAGNGPSDPLGALLRMTDAADKFFKSVQGQDVLKTLADLLQHAGENAARLGQVFVNDILPAIQAFLPFLEQMSTAINTGLVAGLQVLAPIFKALGDTLSALAPALGPIVTAMVFLGTVFTGLTLATKIAAAAMVIFRTAVLGLKAVESIILLLGRLTGQMRLAAAAGALIKGAAVGAALFLIADGLNKVNIEAAGGKDNLTGFAENLNDLVEAGKQLAAGDFAGIFADITAEVEQTAQAWRNGTAPLSGFIAELERFGAFVNSSLAETFAALSAFGAGVNAAIGAAIAGLTNFGTAVNNSITAVLTAFSNFGATVNAAISSAIGVLNSFGAAVNTAISVAIAALSSFGATVNAKIGEAIAFIASLPGRAGAALASFAGILIGVATQAWNGFLSATQTHIASAMGAIGAVPGQAGAALSGLPGVLVNAATTAFNNMLAAVRNGANAVIGFVRSIPGSIAAAIGNLGGTLVGAGRSLMDGLLSGIRAGLNAVLSFARTIAAQIAAVKGPIPKDKKTLVPAGVALMQGLLSGMQSGSGEVLAFASSIADQVARSSSSGLIASAGAFTGSSAASGPNTAGSSLSEQPITVNVMLSQEQITELARVEIARQNRETKRTVLAGSGVTF